MLSTRGGGVLQLARTSLLRSLCATQTTTTAASTTDSPPKPFSEIPGPKSTPLLGNFLGFKHPELGNDPRHVVAIAKHLNEQHGDLVRIEIPLREPMVFVFTPELAEKLYRSVGPKPHRPGFKALDYVRRNDSFFEKARGLLTTQGDEWYEFRSKVQQSMLRPKSTLRYNEALETVALDFINKKVLKMRDSNNQMPDNFLDELYRWGLESVAYIALNVRLGCLEEGLSEDSEQVKIINAVSTIFKTTAVLDNGLLTWKYLPSRDLKKFEEACNLFKETTYKYIHVSLESLKSKPEGEDSGDPTLLELFHSRGCDEKTAVVMALDMMFAGIDTSSHTAGMALYHLAQNPDAQEALYEEICSQLPSKDSRLDNKTIEKMPYLKAVVKETLRMNPPAVANARKLTETLELGGYEIPAESVVVPFHYTIMNSERYVQSPEEFKPERWLKNHELYEKINPFVSLPFGHGARMCIGRRFAEQELYIFIIKMMQHFRVEWHYGKMEFHVQTISFPTKPLKFTFIDR